MCLPTLCPSALILDSATGIFFPRSLYRVSTAKFKYASPELAADPELKPPEGKYYSTIWCSHHRCPRDTLSNRQYQTIGDGQGPKRFLTEYKDAPWLETHELHYPLGKGPRARWLVGNRVQHPLSSIAADRGIKPTHKFKYLPSPRPSGARLGDNQAPNDMIWKRRKDELAYLEPVYEKFWYKGYCLHCLLPVNEAVIHNFLSIGPHCRCKSSASSRHNGCRRCGIVSVKITKIEVFDTVWEPTDSAGPASKSTPKGHDGAIVRRPYWLHLATECKIVETPQEPVPQRLQPTAGQTALEDTLRIIRGHSIQPVDNSHVHARLQDLPLKLILRIMALHTRADKTKNGHVYVMMAAYLFVKAWYGSVAHKMVKGVLDRTDFVEKSDCWPSR
ncbi:hypothetical protein ABW21_db0201619 [Orbilia brochopaga]|nr:hypothetical protein ABW21_db0201619 [Drechslerella brochopaga]